MTCVRGVVAGRRSSRLAVAMALVVALTAAGNLATNRVLPAAMYVPAAIVIALLAVTIAVRVGGCDARDLGLARADLPKGLRYGAVAMAIVAGVLALGAALPATRGFFEDTRVDQRSLVALFYVTLVRIPLGTVLLEETLFRGVILGLGLRLWQPWVAIAWSSLLFGLWHVLPAQGLPDLNPIVAGAFQSPVSRLLAPLAAIAGSGLAGAFFCWLRLRAGSLVAPAMLHTATNSFAYATAWGILRSS
jgi:membrane protease YdiL (CAAX protease family)